MKLPESVIPFLLELKENNNREWFAANKQRYEGVKSDFEEFTTWLIAQIRKFDDTIGALSPKDCTFRIYRDTRFSHDKRPYKTNMGAYIVRGGKNSKFAGYYLHIEPDTLYMAAGGLYMPESELLKELRYSIFYNPQDLKKILQHPDFKKYFGSISGEKLKNPPKGFSSDFADVDLLKYKSYEVTHTLTSEQVQAPDFAEQVIEAFKILKPYNDYMNHIVSQH